MRLLITGICGFVGSTLARTLRDYFPTAQIIDIDNFSRAGSWLNRQPLQDLGIKLWHGDLSTWPWNTAPRLNFRYGLTVVG
jgi:CDP-paratose 2-epimerase